MGVSPIKKIGPPHGRSTREASKTCNGPNSQKRVFPPFTPLKQAKKFGFFKKKNNKTPPINSPSPNNSPLSWGLPGFLKPKW